MADYNDDEFEAMPEKKPESEAHAVGRKIGERWVNSMVRQMEEYAANLAAAPTREQELMRRDMEEANSLKATLDGVFGKQPHPIENSLLTLPVVSELALGIINEFPSMTLGFKDWAQVQAMIEEGIRRGAAQGRQDGRVDPRF